jgi:hypothetical protein
MQVFYPQTLTKRKINQRSEQMEIFLADPIVKITAEKYEYQKLWSLVFSVYAPGDPSPIIYAGIESLEFLQQLLSGWQPAISALEVFQRFGIKPGDPIAGRSFYFPDDGKSAVGHWILPPPSPSRARE